MAADLDDVGDTVAQRRRCVPRPGGSTGRAPGHVRIIGGCWRGRRLFVVRHPAVRPSADRVRETLFNWLSPYIAGADCLDLFAGTGALGFEAVSRGARSALLVESERVVAQQLVNARAGFDTTAVETVHADALKWLEGPARSFDIVFLDPPFDRDYIAVVIPLLRRGWLKPGGLVYVERARHTDTAGPAAGWTILHEGETANVSYALIRAEYTGSMG